MPIELKHVSYSYGAGSTQETAALENLSCFIADGEFVGIMGHTGCGKTTLIQLIAGLLCPTSGQILLDGEDINGKNYRRELLRKTVGLVFQYPEYQLFESTVEKDVAFGLKHSGLSREEKMGRVKEALSLMGFSYENIHNISPLSLSGGEKRRVAIAGVLVTKPRILIFDEPIAGMDPNGRIRFLHLVEKLHKKGTTVLMISHHTDSLCEYASRILVMRQGRLVLDGPPKEVLLDIPRAERFSVGTSQARLISDQLIRRGVPLASDILQYHELLEALTALWKEGDSI